MGASHAQTIPADELSTLKSLLEAEGGMMLVDSDGANYVDYSSAYGTVCDVEKPQAVFVPKTEAGLGAVIVACAQHNVEVSVTTMRFNQNCLSSTTGYMINMRLFDTLQLDTEAMTLRIGAGIFGDEVAVYVQGQGEYHVPGLACVWSGAIGPIFGGGFEWHTQHAWGGHMADLALEFRVMDSTGQVRIANANENTDLFWALRGGGGQLGAVIEVVRRVHDRPPSFSGGYFPLPCAAPCKAEGMLEIMDRVGRWQNTLGDDIGTFASFGAGGARMWVSCLDCDVTAIVQETFPEATFGAMPTIDFPAGAPMSDAYASVRHLSDGFFAGYEEWHVPVRWDYVNDKNPIMPVVFGGFLYTEYDPAMRDMYAECFEADTTNMSATWAWTSYLGASLMNDIDSAASVHKGAKQFWALANTDGHEHMYPILNRGVGRIQTVKSAYWNYKNKYTSEEFSFASNWAEIQTIRAKYDPEGFFALPSRKNEGSGYIDSCFAPYDCSGHGQLADSSLDGIPAGGCECICNSGWSGQRCDAQNSRATIARSGAWALLLLFAHSVHLQMC